MATVLRVKRKRHEIPPKVLLVVSKSKSARGDHKKVLSSTVEKNLFFFALTVATNSPMNEEVKDRVREVISYHQRNKSSSSVSELEKCSTHSKKGISSLKDKLKSMSLSRTQTTTKKLHSHSQSLNRRRSTFPTKTPCIHAQSSSTFQHHKAESADLKQREMKRLKLGEQTGKKGEDVSSSLHPLTQSTEYSVSRTNFRSVDEFVYDLYYSQRTDRWNVKDILYVKPYSYEELTFERKPTTSKYKSFSKYKKNKISNVVKAKKNKVEADNESIDEDERRFIMDEEDDFYDSDDYDAAGRNDDDAFSTFFDGSADDYGGRDDYIDYQDNLANDISYDDGLDYANEVNVDDYTGNIVENL